MSKLVVIEGDTNVSVKRFAIVVARFNSMVVDQLLKGAVSVLKRHGVSEQNITIIYAPGAFELPLVAKTVAEQDKYDGVIALGAVIRGATPHFDYVAGECASGLSRVSLDSSIPVGFGVLTVDSIEQAIERSGTKAGNKGEDAALACIEMVSLMAKINSGNE